ncbi:[FeFe] hydrogenase H-cluster radical SAM maturase HydE, partial [Candidatus Aerophobetes bacterium]|nr:[FeFe] hydrogenase H-cluster radical SAM maturase HydE [Candidatus Aerophobetes bacterium]
MNSHEISALTSSKNKTSLKDWILYLLRELPFEELARMADDVRKQVHGDTVHLRAIIEFSNYCKCNCLF